MEKLTLSVGAWARGMNGRVTDLSLAGTLELAQPGLATLQTGTTV